MYKMVGEVVHQEAPGLFGLTFYQLLGALGGFMLAGWLGLQSPVAALLFSLAGVLAARRIRGLYLYQRAWAVAAWAYRRRVNGAAVLDPAALYAPSAGDPARGGRRTPQTYIVRRPDGQSFTVER